MIFTALFAAIIAVCGFISIPIPGGVPIVLQNMMPVLAGALLGGLQGMGATGLFLTAGALGLPVFSGGRGGMTHLLGITGGFLIGYFFAALITGFIAGKPSSEKKALPFRIAIACLAGFVFIYIPGIIQFMHLTESSLTKTMAVCVMPFLIGDGIKLVVVIILAIKLRPVIARYLEEK